MRPTASSDSARTVDVSCENPLPLNAASKSASMGLVLRPVVAAHLEEELPLGGRQARDAAGVDLVEYAIDLRQRPVVRGGARLRLWRAATPLSTDSPPRHRRHQHARFRHPPQMALCPPQT